MSEEVLRLEIAADERASHDDRLSEVTAYTFSVERGIVYIREHWSDADEIYGEGVSVRMPVRVWLTAASWISAQLEKQKGAAEATP